MIGTLLSDGKMDVDHDELCAILREEEEMECNPMELKVKV
jgi:hypothetical protein